MESRRIIFIVLMAMMLTACKSATLDEAIKEQIPFNVVHVIHTEKTEGGAIVLYTTKQEHNFEPFQALTVAYIKGNDENGWENVGNNHWEYVENKMMTNLVNEFYDYDNKGTLLKKLSVVYGKINSNQIQSIQLINEEQTPKEASIIRHEGKRYYFSIGKYEKIRGIASAGEVIVDYK